MKIKPTNDGDGCNFIIDDKIKLKISGTAIGELGLLESTSIHMEDKNQNIIEQLEIQRLRDDLSNTDYREIDMR